MAEKGQLTSLSSLTERLGNGGVKKIVSFLEKPGKSVASKTLSSFRLFSKVMCTFFPSFLFFPFELVTFRFQGAPLG